MLAQITRKDKDEFHLKHVCLAVCLCLSVSAGGGGAYMRVLCVCICAFACVCLCVCVRVCVCVCVFVFVFVLAYEFVAMRIEAARGGPPPATHLMAVWPLRDGVFVLADFWAFLAFAVPNMTPKTFETEVWAPQKSSSDPPKSRLGASEIEPGASKIEPGALQDAIFLKTFNLRGPQRAGIEVFKGFKSQLGSNLKAQDLPKSRPEPEKKAVKKQHVFGIDF